MPYRVPSQPGSNATNRSDEFAFRTMHVRLGDARFELSCWDYAPALTVGVTAGLAVFALPARALAWPALAVLIVLASARVALVVTREGAWSEHRLLGVCWRRRALGMRPKVSDATGYDWNEISVTPSDVALRAALQDHERVVIAEWRLDHPAKDREAARLVAIANEAIARMHP